MASCTSDICSMRATLSLSTLLRSFGSGWAPFFCFPVRTLPRLVIVETGDDDVLVVFCAGENAQSSRAQKAIARSLFIRLSFPLGLGPGKRRQPWEYGGEGPVITEYRPDVFERQRGLG